MTEYAYESPADSPSAIVRAAVIEQDQGTDFPVAAVLKYTDVDGRTMLRFEAVRCEPFEASLRGWHLEQRAQSLDATEYQLVLDTSAGRMRVRSLRDGDVRWLSGYGSIPLPAGAARELVRVLHEVEAEPGPSGEWQPFDDSDDEPVEFLLAFVSARTRGVYGLAYKTALTDTEDYEKDQFLSWRLPGRWTPAPGTWPVGTDRWVRDAPAPDGDENGNRRRMWTRRIHPECAERFLEAFDSGQWISDDSALAASTGPDGDFHVGDFPAELKERFASYNESAHLDSEDGLIAFFEGRAMLLGDHLLDGLLSIDAGPESTQDEAPSSEWISTVELSRGVNGLDGGGPWRLEVLRTDAGERRHHWWPMDSDRKEIRMGAGCLTVFRDREGHVCRIVLEDQQSFDEAVRAFGLNPDVFGSETLWGGGPEYWREGPHGWVWTFHEQESPFPFAARQRQ